ncbi:TPA: phosphoglycerate kinase [Candidatus Bipolaricaulota bacterium]|nr:phosphoglycerate kinase [Candidatus Bipolaricaulota bacterium]
MKLRTVQEADLAGKLVLLRADFNVPLSQGKVADDFRIRAALPTIRWLLEKRARVAICSHLGRPKGKPVPELSLAPVARRLGELLGQQVPLLPDCIGPEVDRKLEELGERGLVLLENVRFHPGEEANDPEFARALAAPFDLYVNDAFGTAHRAHASTQGVTKHLPAYAGLLLAREVEVLSELTEAPRRPYYILVGGKKAKDKLGVLTDLLSQVDGFLIGGGVSFTFLAAQGKQVGDSIVDEELLPTIKELLQRAADGGTAIHLPVDVVAARELAEVAEAKVFPAEAIPAGWMGLDIGPATRAAFAGVVANAGTVVWAGPMGAFEYPPFAEGTAALARALADSPAFTVVGGGETGEAVVRLGLEKRFSHLSTGGGATLAFLRGKPMPALEPLLAR